MPKIDHSWRQYNLTDLRLLLAVVDAGSLSGGARQLFLAPSSASERLSKLERALGATLLKTVRHRVVPTSAGRVVANHARRCFAGLERMHADLAHYSDTIRGSVALVANGMAMTGLVPDALETFFREHPTVDVALKEAYGTDLVDMIVNGRADMGITSRHDHPQLECTPLHRDELMVVCAPVNALATASSVDFDTCLNQSHIGLRQDSSLHQLIVDKARQRSRHINYRVLVNDLPAVSRLVAADAGLAILPRSALAWIDSQLTVLPLSDPWAIRQMYLATRADADTLNPNATALIEALREAAG